jgi:hypothetical protein
VVKSPLARKELDMHNVCEDDASEDDKNNQDKNIFKKHKPTMMKANLTF